MLYPQDNAFRSTRLLDGIWDFQIDPDDVGRRDAWSSALPAPRPIAVPASWNDQGHDLRGYQDVAWYQIDFIAPVLGQDEVCLLRFGAVSYRCTVYLDGDELGGDDSAFLPFLFDIGARLRPGERHRLSLRVEGLPAADLALGRGDFYEFAGIHRHVHVLVLPRQQITDLMPRSTILDDGSGRISLQVTASGGSAVRVAIPGALAPVDVPLNDGVASVQLTVQDPRLWSCDDPHRYPVLVELLDGAVVRDRYELPVGIRSVAVCGREVLLNGEAVQLRGFGRHEDLPIVGKGLCEPGLVRDFELMKWCGGNSFRTSHYPYSEEQLELADRYGFLVISETPFVNFGSETFLDADLRAHAQSITRRLIERDRRRTCVISFSVGNECKTNEEGAEDFFLPLIDLCRKLDDRPVTYVAWTMAEEDRVWRHADIVGFNRYYGWYKYPERFQCTAREGDLTAGLDELRRCIESFAAQYDGPLFLSEFGADTIAGFHSIAGEQFSEEFQEAFVRGYIAVAEGSGVVCGTHVWNFADFATRQGVTRVMGNKKGVFTREREPKRAAHVLRELWVSD